MLINFGPFPFLCIMHFLCTMRNFAPMPWDSPVSLRWLSFLSFFYGYRVRIPIRIWMEKEHHDSVQMEQEMEKAKSTL